MDSLYGPDDIAIDPKVVDRRRPGQNPVPIF